MDLPSWQKHELEEEQETRRLLDEQRKREDEERLRLRLDDELYDGDYSDGRPGLPGDFFSRIHIYGGLAVVILILLYMAFTGLKGCANQDANNPAASITPAASAVEEP